jgi:hypothetical protein
MFFAALGIAVAVLACREITAPLFAPHTSRYQNGTGTVVVSPANMRGWAFYNDQADAPCTDTTMCRLVQGPASPPSGTGSAELATAAASDGVALVLQDYKGTRLDSITDLHYSTYRQTADAGNNLAIALQLNVDYDLTDQLAGYQGRLVYEPYQGVGGNVPQNTWQSWDAKAGRWWGHEGVGAGERRAHHESLRAGDAVHVDAAPRGVSERRGPCQLRSSRAEGGVQLGGLSWKRRQAGDRRGREHDDL